MDMKPHNQAFMFSEKKRKFNFWQKIEAHSFESNVFHVNLLNSSSILEKFEALTFQIWSLFIVSFYIAVHKCVPFHTLLIVVHR